MKNVLLVIDMQNDFIDGALGTKEAQTIVGSVITRVRSYTEDPDGLVFATRDTHAPDYLQTQEGRNLPVEHCIEGTYGWQICTDLADFIPEDRIFNKPTFGSTELAAAMKDLYEAEGGNVTFEIAGLCTDICVVSNALLLKATLPEARITLDPTCCAGVTPEKHEAALETMRSCQIEIL